MRRGGFDWDERTIAQLRALWAEGASTAAIGRELGCPKNAVVGKVHRLGLAGRPSPILPRDPARAVLKRAPKVTLPALPAMAVAASAPVRRAYPGRPVIASPPARYVEPVRLSSVRACQFPIGDPRKPGFHLCGEPAVLGKSYCPDCCDVATPRWRAQMGRAA